MAISAPKQSAKPALYKMVSVSAIKTGGKTNPQTKAVSSSFVAFTTSINKIGATLNSAVVVASEMRSLMASNLKMRIAQQKKMEAQWKEDRLPNSKKGEGEDGPNWAEKFAGFAAAVVPDFFSSLASLGQFFMRAFIGQAVLRWMSDPENGKKLANIVSGLMKVFKFLYTFITENLFKTIEGLIDMFDSNKSFWERLQGFGNFLVGFGSLLLGFAFLKKPGLIIGGIKWILTTLWGTLFKSKTKLAAQVAKNATAGVGKGAAVAPVGASRGGGLKGLLLNAAVSGGAAFLGASAANSMSGGNEPSAPAAAPQPAPRMEKGGIATRPTPAVLGERGPELRMPLTQIPANNDTLRKNAGIKPLPASMGRGGGKGVDTKKATDLSKLYMTPFRAIGAGLLGSVSEVVTGMGSAGKAVTPFLTNIVAPIANAFNIPPSLVKSVQGKMAGAAKKGGQAVKSVASGGLAKLFGKGSAVSTKSKKFTKKGGNSVLGLLTDLNVAAQVIGNKIGGSSPDPGPAPAPTTPGTPDDSIDQSSPSAKAAGAQGAGSTDVKKNNGSANVAAGQESQNTANYSAKAEDRHGGEVPFKWQGKDYKVVINATNGQYEVWDRFNLNPFAGPYNLAQNKNKALKQAAFNQVRAYFVNNAPQKGLALKYITQDDIANKAKLIEGAKKGQSAAAGGWISGPMSGYPVSLDGGGSTAFIGHGTEWVGFKRAAGGMASSAFVVPFNTPATKNNPNLTGSRLREAKIGGYGLPGFAGGGKAEQQRREKQEEKASGDGRPRKFSAGGKAILEGAKKIKGMGAGASNMCAATTRAALKAAGHPAAEKRTSKGDLDSKGTAYNGRNFAASFAGSDMGTVIKSAGALQAGDIVLWKGGGGYGPGEITHVGIKGEGNDLWHHGRTPGWRKASMYTSSGGQVFAAGIRLDGKAGAVVSGPSDNEESADSLESAEDPKDPTSAFQQVADAIAKLNAPAGAGAEVASATDATKAAKDKAEKEKLNNAASKAAAASKAGVARGGVKASPTANAPAQPIILPGRDNNIPIESLNPSTSILQNRQLAIN